MVVFITPQGCVAELGLAAGVNAGGLVEDVGFGLQQGMATVNQLSVRMIGSLY